MTPGNLVPTPSSLTFFTAIYIYIA
ncbi:unnamed protein product [Spirodela intermedia]|uniref:Uncharacterized protein n=1 Tax=Spirodela intermedia TaxID=51605 RepID=A0A7I8JFC7_SPIIN|nr:unnamed protein product [Spirodela intermedia]CAA6668829.1 unnamed protein product [Spirodela intermedia]